MRASRQRLLARLTEHIAELESRLRGNSGYFTDKDVRISSLATLHRLAESELDALKRSWSYRVGRAVVYPASLIKRVVARLASGRVSRPPTSRRFAPASLERKAAWAERYRRLESRPRFSIVVPVLDTHPGILTRTVESVFEQIYREWELCIADDGSTREATREALGTIGGLDPARVKLVRLERSRGIAQASNAAAGLATGEFLAFLDHDDLLTPDALLEMACAIERVPDADLLYSDEDKLDEDLLVEPFHKPDFSPEQLLTHNYLCHLSVVRTSLFREQGGFLPGFEGSQDYDLMLRLAEHARAIEHVPRILYHWRKSADSAAACTSAKGGPWRESSRKALRSAVRRRGWDARVEDGIVPGTYRTRFAVSDRERVSVIIPTRDRVDLLDRCITSIRKHTLHREYEIVVISNGSEEEAIVGYLERAGPADTLRVIRHDAPFNFSEINNLGARTSDAPYLLFVNDDLEVLADGWMESMLEFAQQSPIGAVGAKLLYPGGRIQHAGVVLGLMGVAGHAHRGIREETHGYFGQADVIRNVSAVTGACLMTRRDVFERVGGFDERLAVAWNDVDYCLKVTGAGYRIVYTPHARLFHRESSTRGPDGLDDARFRAEVALLAAKWGERLYGNDPFYNRNLTRWREDFGPAAAGEAERTREFRERFPAAARTVAADASRKAAVACAPRSAYKEVWNALAVEEPEARLNVIGSPDEADFSTTAHETVAILGESVGIEPDETVLEIGCGVGRVGELLAGRCRRWVGCDVSRNMLRHASERLAGCGNVRLVEISGFDLAPIGDGSIDVVYCTVVFMHLDEWERYGYVREAHRILRPGGRLYVDNVNLRSDQGWSVFERHRELPPAERPAHISKTSTPQELETYFLRAGFRDIRCREAGSWVRCWASK